MDYLAWRTTFQDADQAARAALDEAQKLRIEVTRLTAENAHQRLLEPGRRAEHHITRAPHVGPTDFEAWGIHE